MTRAEYLEALGAALRKQHVQDVQDILSEYDDHFVCKLADGYSEEEISARLGDPAALAAQFAPNDRPQKSASQRFLVRAGLFFADLLELLVFTLLLAFGLVLAAAAVAFAAAGLCLVLHINVYALIPSMPYYCACILGLALLALSVLTATGCIWYGAYLRQSLRAFFRFRNNALAAVENRAALPAIPARPQLSPAHARRLRTTARISVTVFAVLFVVALVVSVIYAGSFQFWHVWGWFGYGK